MLRWEHPGQSTLINNVHSLKKHNNKLTMIRVGKTPFQKPSIPASLYRSLTYKTCTSSSWEYNAMSNLKLQVTWCFMFTCLLCTQMTTTFSLDKVKHRLSQGSRIFFLSTWNVSCGSSWRKIGIFGGWAIEAYCVNGSLLHISRWHIGTCCYRIRSRNPAFNLP